MSNRLIGLQILGSLALFLWVWAWIWAWAEYNLNGLIILAAEISPLVIFALWLVASGN